MRLKTLTWRSVKPEDRPELEAIQAQLNASVGRDLELPDLNGKSVRYAMVAEKSGKIIGAWYAEPVLELKFCSIAPEFTASAKRDCWDFLCGMAAVDGIRYIHCPVPKEANPRIHEALTDGLGMYESKNLFFVKDLR